MAKYRYGYDQAGNLVKSLDILNGIEYNYYYKGECIQRATESAVELQRISGCKTENVVSKTLKHSVFYHYDTEGNLTKKRYIADGKETVYSIEHKEDGTQIYTLPTGVVSHSKTDHLGRLEFDELQLGKGFINRQFSYHEGEITQKHIEKNMLKSSPTTTLVSKIVLSDGSTLSYEYDAEERIIGVVDKHSFNGEVIETKYEYTYDALGQLLTETVNGVAVNTMTYDNYGNILTKNGKTYTYGDSKWKDLLTEYDGQTITYDDGGNPINYLGHTLTWEKGRQLKSFDDITYTYNANGIRTSKTVNGVEHKYTLDDTNIVKETWDGNTLVPLYDNTESVCGITYNGASYYFLKNLQGDVIAITDSTGSVVARYSYDAWGVCTIESDTTDCNIAEINPYRYRGYYLDREIGMYYLQSRYYDPQIGRFVNGDMAEFAVMQQGVVEHNLFAYCGNDCVNDKDDIGTFSLKKVWDMFKKVLNIIKSSFKKYLESLWGKDGKNYYVSTFVIATVIDGMISIVVSALVARGLKVVIKNVLRIFARQSKYKFIEFVKSFLSFLVNNPIGKVLLSLIVSCAVRKAKKREGLVSSIVKDYLTNIIGNQSELFRKVNSIISAFSSFGGMIAFALDRSDGNWDDRFSIKFA